MGFSDRLRLLLKRFSAKQRFRTSRRRGGYCLRSRQGKVYHRQYNELDQYCQPFTEEKCEAGSTAATDEEPDSSECSPGISPPEAEPETMLRTVTELIRLSHKREDSFQGSLLSIDSLTDSYWDYGDDNSTATALKSNRAKDQTRFTEHIAFLGTQCKSSNLEGSRRE